MSVTNTIIVNAISTAVDACVNSSIAFEQACATVREYRATGKLDNKTARQYFQAALISKVPAYAKQVTETGKPEAGSAYQRAVTRLMAATNPEGDSHKPAEELVVPADVLAAAKKLWALCAEYEGAAKLCATAIANVKSGK